MKKKNSQAYYYEEYLLGKRIICIFAANNYTNKTMEQNNLVNIELTDSQKNVLKKILDFVTNSTDRVFILKGYAGTGKTTLMRFLIQELENSHKDYRLLASTGRAAKVLANLSNRNGSTSTIHSMVYSFNGLSKEYDE